MQLNNNNHKTNVRTSCPGIMYGCVHSGEKNYIIIFSIMAQQDGSICFFDDELRAPGLKKAVELASIILTLFLLVLFFRTLHQSL